MFSAFRIILILENAYFQDSCVFDEMCTHIFRLCMSNWPIRYNSRTIAAACVYIVSIWANIQVLCSPILFLPRDASLLLQIS